METSLGNRPLGTIIHDLSSVGMNVLVLALYHGLKADDKALNPNLVERILDDHLKNGGRLGPIYDSITKALEESGVFRSAGDGDDEGKSQTPVQS